MVTYTNVSKPSSTPYSNANARGKEQYDQSNLIYDDTTAFYDGVNLMAYSYADIPTLAWNVNYATLFNSYSVAAQTIFPEALFFSPDGDKMYVSDGAGTANLFEYSLSTAWDVSSRSLTNTLNLEPTVDFPASVFFKDDGLTMYVADSTPDTVFQYTLSTAWNISTASLSTSKNVTATAPNPEGMYFSFDGTRMFLVSYTNQAVAQYDLTEPWAVSGAIYRQSFSVATQSDQPDSVYFRSDGKRMYITNGGTPSKVIEYGLVEPWNVATAYFNKNLIVSATDINTFAAFFRADGLRLFIISSTNSSVMEYRFTSPYTNVNKPT